MSETDISCAGLSLRKFMMVAGEGHNFSAKFEAFFGIFFLKYIKLRFKTLPTGVKCWEKCIFFHYSVSEPYIYGSNALVTVRSTLLTWCTKFVCIQCILAWVCPLGNNVSWLLFLSRNIRSMVKFTDFFMKLPVVCLPE